MNRVVLVLLVVCAWICLLVGVACMCWAVHNSPQHSVPEMIQVEALSLTRPRSTTVDGVVIQPGQRVLVWAANPAVQDTEILEMNKKQEWKVVQHNMLTGSHSNVRGGLQYAHSSFAIRNGQWLPLWQHWMLTVPMTGDGNGIYHLQTDNSGKQLDPVKII